jgi:hypothetical protein
MNQTPKPTPFAEAQSAKLKGILESAITAIITIDDRGLIEAVIGASLPGHCKVAALTRSCQRRIESAVPQAWRCLRKKKPTRIWHDVTSRFELDGEH